MIGVRVGVGKQIFPVVRAFALVFLAALSSCGKSGFDISTKEKFVASCVANATDLSPQVGLSPWMVSEFFRFASKRPDSIVLSSGFDPSKEVPMQELVRVSKKQTEVSECEGAWPNAAMIASLRPADALWMGIHNYRSMISDDKRILDSTRYEIERSDKEAARRLASLQSRMKDFAPRALSYRLVNYEGRAAPSVVIEAANAVGRPIDAFLLVVHLASLNGGYTATGNVRFDLPVPLGIGQQSTYVLNLAGVGGIDIPSVIDSPVPLRPFIELHDIIAEGSPVLGKLHHNPEDDKRLFTLGMLRHNLVVRMKQMAVVNGRTAEFFAKYRRASG